MLNGNSNAIIGGPDVLVDGRLLVIYSKHKSVGLKGLTDILSVNRIIKLVPKTANQDKPKKMVAIREFP